MAAANRHSEIEKAGHVRGNRKVLGGGSHLYPPAQGGRYIERKSGTVGLGDSFSHLRVPFRRKFG